MTKQYWWVSVGGNPCEPAILIGDEEGQKVYTIGCADCFEMPHKNVELIKKMGEAPDTPEEAEKKQLKWEKERQRMGFHGYRIF